MLGVDNAPMTGFLQKEYDRILGIEKDGYSSAVALALGKRNESDSRAKSKKFRCPLNMLVKWFV
jgi:nitroreductase